MTDFHSLYQHQAPVVRRFAQFLCGDPALADDITSETFVHAWTAQGRIRQETVKSYLLTIARNVYRDLLRRRRPQTTLDENAPDGRISPQAQLEQEAELRAVLAGLQRLPETDRAALLMRALDEMPYEEIAAALGLTPAAARVKVHRARVELMRARKPFQQEISVPGGKP